VGSANESCRTIERVLCEIWANLLRADVSPHDDFFEIGGNSLKVVDAVIAARERGISFRSSAVFRNPTPARLAENLTIRARRAAGEGAPGSLTALTATDAEIARARGGAGGGADRYLVPIVEGGTGVPLFLVHSDHFVEAERDSVRTWGCERPIHGFVAPGFRGTAPWAGTIGGLAERYVGELLDAQPEGPHFLAGVGTGAVVAFEMGRVLRGRSHEVGLLAMIKPPPLGRAPGGEADGFDGALRTQLALMSWRFGLGGNESGEEVLARVRQEGWYDGETEAADLPRLQLASAAIALALRRYRPGVYDGPVVLFQDGEDAEMTAEAWGTAAADCAAYWFDYGVESLRPILVDPRVADIMQKELAL
jgi:thioesterase domain-containing protein